MNKKELFDTFVDLECPKCYIKLISKNKILICPNCGIWNIFDTQNLLIHYISIKDNLIKVSSTKLETKKAINKIIKKLKDLLIKLKSIHNQQEIA